MKLGGKLTRIRPQEALVHIHLYRISKKRIDGAETKSLGLILKGFSFLQINIDINRKGCYIMEIRKVSSLFGMSLKFTQHNHSNSNLCYFSSSNEFLLYCTAVYNLHRTANIAFRVVFESTLNVTWAATTLQCKRCLHYCNSSDGTCENRVWENS